MHARQQVCLAVADEQRCDLLRELRISRADKVLERRRAVGGVEAADFAEQPVEGADLPAEPAPLSLTAPAEEAEADALEEAAAAAAALSDASAAVGSGVADEIDEIERSDGAARGVVHEADEQRAREGGGGGGKPSAMAAAGGTRPAGWPLEIWIGRAQGCAWPRSARVHEHKWMRPTRRRRRLRLLAVRPAGGEQIDDRVVPHIPAGDAQSEIGPAHVDGVEELAHEARAEAIAFRYGGVARPEESVALAGAGLAHGDD